MYKKQAKRRPGMNLLAVVCAVFIIVAAFPFSVAAETAEERYQRLKGELDAISAQIEAVKDDKAAAEQLRANLQAENELVSELIAINQQEIADAEQNLALMQEQVQQKQKALQESEALFEQRMVAIYQMNTTNVLASILSVESFSEFFQMIDAMVRISSNDTEMLDKMKVQKDALDKEQAELDQLLDSLNNTYDELSGNAGLLAANIAAQDNQISLSDAALKANEEAYGYTQAEADQAYQDMLALSNAIANEGSSAGEGIPGLVTTQPPAQETQPPAETTPPTEGGTEAPETSGGLETPGGEAPAETQPPVETAPPETAPPEASEPVYGSVYVWPVPSSQRITCHFGAADPNGNAHLGMDIGAPTGTPIVAAGYGSVTRATWHDSYGYYVIVDHGNGLKTLYAHCSSLLVGVGQVVNPGDIIALVGSTGFSTGPHLHFEVHAGGVRQNPLNYVG